MAKAKTFEYPQLVRKPPPIQPKKKVPGKKMGKRGW
jgi:hypothetical protein